MAAPSDHATPDTDALGVEGGDITYAALLDRHAAEEPITDEMVRRACLRMESAQAWPFATAPDDERDGAHGDDAPAASVAGGTLAKLLRIRR